MATETIKDESYAMNKYVHTFSYNTYLDEFDYVSFRIKLKFKEIIRLCELSLQCKLLQNKDFFKLNPEYVEYINQYIKNNEIRIPKQLQNASFEYNFFTNKCSIPSSKLKFLTQNDIILMNINKSKDAWSLNPYYVQYIEEYKKTGKVHISKKIDDSIEDIKFLRSMEIPFSSIYMKYTYNEHTGLSNTIIWTSPFFSIPTFLYLISDDPLKISSYSLGLLVGSILIPYGLLHDKIKTELEKDDYKPLHVDFIKDYLN